MESQNPSTGITAPINSWSFTGSIKGGKIAYPHTNRKSHKGKLSFVNSQQDVVDYFYWHTL